MNKITVLLTFICLFSAALKTSAQEYNYYHYDVKDGLSGNTIYNIVQDKDGFLWYGTETGLSRFDGKTFKNFTAIDGLYDNEIISLFVDSKNRVWIFPFKNAIYYYSEGKIHNKSNDSLLKQFHLKNEIFKACEDKNGNIFFTEHKRTHILTNDGKLIEVNKIESRNFTNNVCGIDDKGICNIYLSFVNGTDNSISIIEYRDKKLTLKGQFQDSVFSRNSFEVNPFYTVIRNGKRIMVYNRSKRKNFEVKVPEHFHTVSYLNDSLFGISTLSKTLLYNVNQQKITDSFLLNKAVNKCFKDKENNLWFATATQGVYRLPPTRIQIYRFGNSMNFMPVYALNFFENNLYIGSDKDILWILDIKNNKLDSLTLGPVYTGNNILNIQIENNNELFFGSNTGMYRFNRQQASIYLPEVAIKSLFIYSNLILVATDRAAFEFPVTSGAKIDTIWNGRATYVVKIDKRYYVGTLNGLYSVDNNMRHTNINWGNSFSQLKDKIISLRPSSDRSLWIGTESHGLLCLKDDKLFCNLTIQDGLVSNLCRCIYVNGKDIWVGTDKGISRIEISKYPFKITNYTAADGLDCEIINCIYASGDSVFVGTPYGLTFFNANTALQKSICNLKLLNVQSNEANWYAKQDSIHLSSRDNLLRFEYAGISFVSAGDITYYYQLKGLSDEWQSTRQNVLEFPSLYPGDYALNMYAVNKYGVKSKMLTVHFTKAKHYWQLLWVQVLLLLILIMLMWLVARARIRSVRRKADENLLREKRINELEQMALKAQMNPHFIFNSINSIQQYVFSGNVAEANEYITDFSSLVRQTLDMSGKKFITLTEEIMYLKAYLGLEQKKYEHCFNFTVVTDNNTDETVLLPPLLIQPFVENSIRHGVLNLKKEKGRILVHFFKEGNTLCCIVEDNGIGRAKAIELKRNVNPVYESKGMELVKNRMESLNNIYKSDITVAIEDIDEQGNTGTRVIIKFPLDYDEQNN